MFSLSLILFRFFLIVSLETNTKNISFDINCFGLLIFSLSSRPPSTFLCCSSCGAAVVGLRPELSDSSAGHCTIGLFFPLCTTGLFFLTLLVHYWSLFSDSFCALLISFFPYLFSPLLSAISTAQCVLCSVYLSTQPNKLRLILKFYLCIPLNIIFASACSNVRKIHLFTHL